MLILKITGDGLPKLNRALDELGNETVAHKAYRRAINKIGDQARTRVKRELAAQVGLTQKKLVELGGFRVTRANYSALEYKISTSGSPIPLKEFSAKQFSYGVRAKPWGRSQQFPSAFIYAGRWDSGNAIADGHVFKRTSKNSLPIEKLYGPSIPKEMVQGATAAAFTEYGPKLRERVEHELRQITQGVVS
ncbi:Prophage minor tail protein Z (GPZ) [Fulvimarina manganoxydans]|uniref:Prophage minor tail protein Z (GPZ) n=1 Tax=Fulvimarina manganoxydans TaxID=937218 RepID=A0A1W1Z402_9HYPH|nr:phage tail protein [Fulvimarina manganoxydans]SMC42831.1 Prophage minor tail protein Z (GPZ) [Fulvimarina manganoxydans]